MMSSRSQSALARKRKLRAAGLLLFLVLLAAAAAWRGSLSGAFWQLVSPVMRARFATDDAAAAAASTTAALADRDALYAENQELKRMLGRDAASKSILAGVILRPPATPYDTLVIDAGFSENVARGDEVVAGGTAIVGIVTDLYTHAARVTLFSAPGQRYDGLLHVNAGARTLPVAVEGQGGASLTAKVPAGTSVVPGDYVTLPGVASSFLARVSAVDRGESDSFSTVYLTLPVNPSSLHFVEVRAKASHDVQ